MVCKSRKGMILPEGTQTPFTSGFQGEIPFIVSVLNADIMATLVELKAEVEKKWGSKMRMNFIGGLEAHLIAKELGNFTFIPREWSHPHKRHLHRRTRNRRHLGPSTPVPDHVERTQSVSLRVTSLPTRP